MGNYNGDSMEIFSGYPRMGIINHGIYWYDGKHVLGISMNTSSKNSSSYSTGFSSCNTISTGFS